MSDDTPIEINVNLSPSEQLALVTLAASVLPDHAAGLAEKLGAWAREHDYHVIQVAWAAIAAIVHQRGPENEVKTKDAICFLASLIAEPGFSERVAAVVEGLALARVTPSDGGGH